MKWHACSKPLLPSGHSLTLLARRAPDGQFLQKWYFQAHNDLLLMQIPSFNYLDCLPRGGHCSEHACELILFNHYHDSVMQILPLHLGLGNPEHRESEELNEFGATAIWCPLCVLCIAYGFVFTWNSLATTPTLSHVVFLGNVLFLERFKQNVFASGKPLWRINLITFIYALGQKHSMSLAQLSYFGF